MRKCANNTPDSNFITFHMQSGAQFKSCVNCASRFDRPWSLCHRTRALESLTPNLRHWTSLREFARASTSFEQFGQAWKCAHCNRPRWPSFLRGHCHVLSRELVTDAACFILARLQPIWRRGRAVSEGSAGYDKRARPDPHE